MLSSDHQVYSDSDESLDCFPRKKPKILDVNEQSFDKDISINEGSQNYDEIEEMNNYFDHKNKNLDNNQNMSSGVSDDDDYNVNNYEDSESEDYVPISDGEFKLEKYVINETNSKTDVESVKDVDVGVGTNDSNDDEPIAIDNDELYDLLDKSCSDKNNDDEPIAIDSDELYDLLDESYSDKNKSHNKHNKTTVTPDDYEEYQKTVLEEVCKNHFDILPENWIETIHKSGMPIYLHKKSRVVTLSRPYFLGPGDPKSHLAPLSAISCLQYQKGLENKEMINNEPDSHVSKLGDMIIPNAKVETAQENIIKESLTHEELREYCQSLFK